MCVEARRENFKILNRRRQVTGGQNPRNKGSRLKEMVR